MERLKSKYLLPKKLNCNKRQIGFSLLLASFLSSISLCPLFSQAQNVQTSVKPIVLLALDEYDVRSFPDRILIRLELAQYLTDPPEGFKELQIKNYKKFREEVVRCSGLPVEELSQLSIKESLLLTGQMVKQRLDYSTVLAEEIADETPAERYARAMAARVLDQNPKAKNEKG
jgi:hypothetical protein